MAEPAPDDLPIAQRADAPAPIALGYAPPALRATAGRWPMIVFVVAVLLRLAWAQRQSSDPGTLINLPDQTEYVQIAQSILGGDGIRLDDVGMRQYVYAFRMPGYPLLVAACGANLAAVRIVQAVLDGSSAVAALLLARRLRGETAGRVAGLAVALHPYLIYFSALILSETLFTAMVAWGVLLLTCSSVRARVGGILLLLAGVYVRPSAVGLGVTAGAFLLVGVRHRWPRGALGIGASALALVLLLSPWAIRNRVKLGRAIWTTTNSGYTAYDSFNPYADGSSNQKHFRVSLDDPALRLRGAEAEQVAIYEPLATFYRLNALGELGRNDFFLRLALDYAREHPRRVVMLAAAKLARFWSPWPLSQDFGDWRYVLVGGVYVVPLFALALVGLWRGGLGRRTVLILLLPALYFSAVHCVFVGSLRYRVPCDVPLAVLAGVGAASLVRPKAVAE